MTQYSLMSKMSGAFIIGPSCQVLLNENNPYLHYEFVKKEGRQYFAVVSKGNMYIFENAFSDGPLYSVSLTFYSDCCRSNISLSCDRKWSFRLKTLNDERSHLFSTVSSKSLEKWMKLLKLNITYAKSNGNDCSSNKTDKFMEFDALEESNLADTSFDLRSDNEIYNVPISMDNELKSIYNLDTWKHNGEWTGSFEEGEKIMKDMKINGTYMIRKSRDQATFRVLAVKYPFYVAKFKIMQKGDFYSLFDVGLFFTSIGDLLKYYECHELPDISTLHVFNCRLKEPYTKHYVKTISQWL